MRAWEPTCDEALDYLLQKGFDASVYAIREELESKDRTLDAAEKMAERIISEKDEYISELEGAVARAIADRDRQAIAISGCIESADSCLDKVGIPRSDNGILTWWYRVELASREIVRLRAAHQSGIYEIECHECGQSEVFLCGRCNSKIGGENTSE